MFMITLFMTSPCTLQKYSHRFRPRNCHLKQSLEGVLCFGLWSTCNLFLESGLSPWQYVCNFMIRVLSVLFVRQWAGILPCWHNNLLLCCCCHSPVNRCLHAPSPTVPPILPNPSWVANRLLNGLRVHDIKINKVVFRLMFSQQKHSELAQRSSETRGFNAHVTLYFYSKFVKYNSCARNLGGPR